MSLKQLVEGFQNVNYGRVTRGEQAYVESIDITTSELTRLVALYKQGGGLQHLRLIRDSIDHWIRRYHGYAIEGSIGTHYRERGLTAKGIFEHVIPASKLRDMLLTGTLTIGQALNAPVCRISVDNDDYLRQAGLVSTNNNYWNFFLRYSDLEGTIIETHKGQEIDIMTWTLQDHYNYFGIV